MGFLPLMSGRERVFYRARTLANAMQKRTSRRCRRAAGRASHVWVIGEANRQLVEDTWGCTAEPMLEVGGEPHPDGRVRTYDGTRALRLVWSGQHIGRKALPLLQLALASLGGKPAVELTVLGEGPETNAWKALAERLGIAPLVRWTGRLTREAALREMAAADAFVSTSVLEETSLVVLEALSLGLPVVCHDACGMGVAVTDTCGVKVPLRTPETSVAGFAAAVKHLAAGGERFCQLSAGALARGAELSWDDKAAAIAATYDRVIASRADTSGRGRGADVNRPPENAD
jgi:glycosyltransferase involved in cell wall biosynthesis